MSRAQVSLVPCALLYDLLYVPLWALQEAAAADLADAVLRSGAAGRWLQPAQLALLAAAEEGGRVTEGAASLQRACASLAKQSTGFGPAACQQLQLLASQLSARLHAISNPTAAVTAAAGFLTAAGLSLDPEAEQAVSSVQLAEQLATDCPAALQRVAAQHSGAAAEVAAALAAHPGALLQLLPEGPRRSAEALAAAADPLAYLAACCSVSSSHAVGSQGDNDAVQMLNSLARFSASRTAGTQACELVADTVAVLASQDIAVHLRQLLSPTAGPAQILLGAAGVAGAAVLPVVGDRGAAGLTALYARLQRLAGHCSFEATETWTEAAKKGSALDLITTNVTSNIPASPLSLSTLYKVCRAAHKGERSKALQVRGDCCSSLPPLSLRPQLQGISNGTPYSCAGCHHGRA
jgi:hypothetical protein